MGKNKQDGRKDLIAQRLFAAMPIVELPTEAERLRSDQNVSQWLSYLPEDCVRAMVDCGWDRTA